MRASLARASSVLEGDLPAEGAQALGDLRRPTSAGLFEAIKLPRPVGDSCVEISAMRRRRAARSTRVAAGNWCVALVNRQLFARIFRGSRDHPATRSGGSWRTTGCTAVTIRAAGRRRATSAASTRRRPTTSRTRSTSSCSHFKRQPVRAAHRRRAARGGRRLRVASCTGYLRRAAGRAASTWTWSTRTPEQVLEAARAALRGARGGAREPRRWSGSARAAAPPTGLEEVLRGAERAARGGAGGRRALLGGGHASAHSCGWLGPAGERSCPVDETEL